jgi:acyl carrier protein
MNDAEILQGVAECVAEVADVDLAIVTPEKRIILDLGADSLDLLDLIFKLEQRFGIRIEPRGIERRAREELGGEPFEQDGQLTPAAIARLREYLPEVPPEELPAGLPPPRLPYVFRVQTFANLVKRLREEQQV